MLVQALHIVTQFFPTAPLARIVAAARHHPLLRRGRPDRFIRDIPQVSGQWLADHCRATSREGEQP